MAKFNAGKAVERMEYDFTDFDGSKGFVHEPTTGQVSAFFGTVRNLMADVQSMAGGKEIENLTEEDIAANPDLVTGAMDKVQNLQERMTDAVAVLCGAETNEDGEIENPDTGSPTAAELRGLPHRVSQAFTQWLIEQVKPKRTTPGTKR